MDSYVIDNKKLIHVNSIDNIYIVFYIFSGVEIIAFKISFFPLDGQRTGYWYLWTLLFGQNICRYEPCYRVNPNFLSDEDP